MKFISNFNDPLCFNIYAIFTMLYFSSFVMDLKKNTSVVITQFELSLKAGSHQWDLHPYRRANPNFM